MSEKSKLVGLKPSGIKPPSKRICTKTEDANAEKVITQKNERKIVPPTTYEAGSSIADTKVAASESSNTSEEPDKLKAAAQQHRGPLADVAEEGIGDAETEMFKHSKPPSGLQRKMSITSCDTDGSRPSTDQSLVLTKDTDSFIIGQRVWVGGKRAGQIAYIGETQFAPGDWAGIVLDEANGKNDGCVSGVRYFQCPPRRGVFSRLTRLTLSPLPDDEQPQQRTRDDISTTGMPKSPYQNSAYHHYACMSPGSKRTSPAPSVTSMASRSPSKTPQVGERVIVQSSQGSKVGILRFLGETKFANGIWAGVELDDPTGKNDGCVEGHRYFVCPPKHGLFAPSAKVTLSPSARKAQRTNSRESLLSSASDLLKEKQHHIEQLLKEREMERTEVDQAMLQASQARKEYEKLKQNLLLLQEENLKLKNQLEDEARKAEDLQFNVLEQTIYKEDLSTINSEQIALNKSNSEKISELEQMVSDRDAQIKELRAQALSTDSVLKMNSDNESETISKFRSQLEQAQDLLQVLEADKMEMLKSLEDEKIRHEKEEEKMKTNHEKAFNLLNSQLSEALQKLVGAESTTQAHDMLFKENARLKMEFSAKQADLEEQQQSFTKQNEEIEILKTTINTLKTELETKNIEISAKISQEKITGDNLQKELEESRALAQELQKTINEKNLEIENFVKQGLSSEDRINYLSKLVEELKAELVNRDRAIEAQYIEMKSIEQSLKDELENKNAEFTLLERNHVSELNTLKADIKKMENNKQQSVETLQLKLDAELTSFKIKTDALEKDILSLEENLQAKTLECSKISEDLKNRSDEYKNEKENLQKTLQNLENTVKQLNASLAASDETVREKNQMISTLDLERGDLLRKVEAFQEKIEDLGQVKTKLENDIEALRNNTHDSNSELMKLASELKNKDQELMKAKETLSENKINFESQKQQLEQELNLQTEEWKKKLSQLEEKLKEYEQNNLIQVQSLESQKADFAKQKSEFEKKLNELEKQKNQMETVRNTTKENNEKHVTELTSKINMLENEKNKLENVLELKQNEFAVKCENLTKIEEDLQNNKKTIESLEKHCIDLELLNKTSEKNKSELQKKLESSKIEIIELTKQIETLGSNSDKATQDLIKQINEKDVLIDEMTKSTTKREADYSNELTALSSTLVEKQSAFDKLSEDLNEKEKQYNEFKITYEKNYENMRNELEQSKNLNSDLENKLHLAEDNIKSLNLEKEQSIESMNNKIKEINTDNENLKLSNQEQSEQMKKLQKELFENKSSLNEINKNFEKQLSEYAILQKSLHEKEQTILAQQGKLVSSNEKLAMLTAEKETETVAKITSMEMEIENLKKKAKAESEQHSNRILELTEKLKAAEKHVSDITDSQRYKMQNTEKQIHELLTKNSNLENELSLLRSSQNNITVEEDTIAVVNNNNSKSENELFLHSQVQFLNSIIADMKHKETQLQNKVEALEGGSFNPELLNIKSKKPAPRLYCDICEEFDAHDTEDCPRQDTDSPVKTPTRNVPPPRPYCMICEEFGHESENCDADETY